MMEGEEHRYTMRIRTYRSGDIPTLVDIQQTAAQCDGLVATTEAELEQLLAQAMRRSGYNVFLITDDDDEINTWGQGETLEGIEGEVVGYAILQLDKSSHAYHIRSQGAVLPEQRQRGAGHALLLCALNHARMQAINIVTEARQQGLPIYFEVELPERDPTTEALARLFELEMTDQAAQTGMRLYRTEL
jgi:N-acetylglutamate synthase-like GNAT family acetyltransferase